jgi:hypothetical protein
VLDLRRRGALAFLQATALPLIVVITEIGTSTGRMRPDNATALLAAGMLSVLVFPLSGFAVLGGTSPAPSETEPSGTEPTAAEPTETSPAEVEP